MKSVCKLKWKQKCCRVELIFSEIISTTIPFTFWELLIAEATLLYLVSNTCWATRNVLLLYEAEKKVKKPSLHITPTYSPHPIYPLSHPPWTLVSRQVDTFSVFASSTLTAQCPTRAISTSRSHMPCILNCVHTVKSSIDRIKVLLLIDYALLWFINH